MTQFIRKLTAFCARRPEIPLTIVAGVFYAVSLRHLPSFWIVLLTLPVMILNYLLLYLGRRFLRARLARGELRMGLELLLAAVALLGLHLTDFVKDDLLAAWLSAAALLWLLALARFGRPGPFYTVFIGIMLFTLGVFSQRFVFLEERLAAVAARYVAEYQARAERENAYRWEEGNDGLRELYVRGRRVIRIVVPENLHFHDGRTSADPYDVPRPGLPVFYLSGSPTDPFAAPAVGVYFLDAEHPPGMLTRPLESGGDLHPAQFTPLFREAFGRRRNSGEVDEIPEPERLKLPADLLTGSFVPDYGVAYRYYDRIYEQDFRLSLFLSAPLPPDGLRFAVILEEQQPQGLPFTWPIAAALRSLRFTVE